MNGIELTVASTFPRFRSNRQQLGSFSTVLAIERHRIKLAEGTVRVTVSIGVAVFTPDRSDADLRKALERADIALYQAKTFGRNRVIVAADTALGELTLPRQVASAY
ncbi:MAG TPA: diguanylate cyclase [Fontimonas sp.]